MVFLRLQEIMWIPVCGYCMIRNTGCRKAIYYRYCTIMPVVCYIIMMAQPQPNKLMAMLILKSATGASGLTSTARGGGGGGGGTPD
jgi:hypothetical protein